MSTTSPQPNAQVLRQLFLDRLLGLQPQSVLDVGCGQGQILDALEVARVPATGIEPHPQKVAPLTARGLRAVVADAAALPAGDGEFDWVTIRHVLHHLSDPGKALGEAMRACRRGVLLAEPWYDLSLPCQRVADRCDRWLTVQLQRCGEIHEDVLNTADVLRHLPHLGPGDVEVDHHLRWCARDPADFRAEAEPFLDDLPADAEQRRELAELLAAAERAGLSWNGTLVVVVRKPARRARSPDYPSVRQDSQAM